MTTRVRMQEAFKFALAMTLAYWVALAFDWGLPKYAGLAVVLISLDTTGASLQKGLARVAGTVAGVFVAWWMIGAFFDDRWLFMSAMAVHLAFCAYVMQRSRVPYAWFVTGFVPLVVWLNSYADPGNAFHFGVFRFLETASGVLIWTVIAALLWPRCAGDQVIAKGAQLWAAAGDLLASSARRLDESASADGVAAEAQLGAVVPALKKAIGAAVLDTPAVRERRGSWSAMPGRLDRLATALEMHRLAVVDVCAAGGAEAAAAAAPFHRALGARLRRLDGLWAQAARSGAARRDAGTQDSGTPETGTSGSGNGADVPVPDLASADVSRDGRLALAVLSARLTDLDEATRSLEGALSETDAPAPARPPARPSASSAWDLRRLGFALLPATCFLLGCVLWILTDPPTGAGIPEFAGILGLLTLTLPDRRLLRPTVLALLKGLACCVPVYFFVMPWLGGGPGILVVIFLFSSVFGWLGVSNPMLRLGAMAMFATTTGISNEQTYSFLTFANSATMLLLAGGIALLVYGTLAPVCGENDFVASVRSFFATAARIARGEAGVAAARLAPALAAARGARKHLDPAVAPADCPDRVDALLAAMETLSLRLLALERERDVWRSGALEAGAAAVEPLHRAEERIQRTLEGLSVGGTPPSLHDADADLGAAAHAFAESVTGRDDEPAARDGYAVIGAARGVLVITDEARAASAEIDWDAWSAARF